MIRRRLWASLLGIVVVAAGLLGANLGLGNEPVLGLDLQGGVSVILRPDGEATGDDLLVIRDLIRDELENRGIAEPDVRVEGSNIIVDLPGVRDQADALDAVDVAGIVTFRPVFACGLQTGEPDTGSTLPGSAVPGSAVPGSGPVSGSAVPGSAVPGSGPVVDDPTPATTATAGSGSTPVSPSGFAATARPRSVPPTSPPATGTAPTDTGAPTDTSGAGDVPDSTIVGTDETIPGSLPPVASSPSADLGQQEVLRSIDGSQCLVGPPAGGGESFSRNSSSVEFDGGRGWVVVAGLTGEGESSWNAAALQCFNGLETCPSRQLAIVLDDVVQSAPEVIAPSFSGEVSITGMQEGEARSLARVIDRGAFPVRVEPATVQTVSPTLGQDSMRASVFAGLVGVALVLVMLVVYYRYLTVLILVGMTVWAMLIYSVSALISEMTNYALTLAGVTGIIVSIGMTVDSYVIYFERLKDEVRHGRTLRNSAARSFKSTWRTILAANLISVIGAAVLFVLSVGSVRGFALYLGVTTVCDILVLWCFTRPAVILLAGTGRLDRRDTFGLEARASERAGATS